MVGKTLKHYRIEELLGRGGMGEVYRATDLKLSRPVAVKVLKPELTTNPQRRKRFLQEARAAAAVVHPALAAIYDVDEAEGTTFIVMEFIEGHTVGWLIAHKELDLLGSVEVALQVSQGLAVAHKAQIVHRDIKSDNIMVTRDGHAKILDFGLAKLLEPGDDWPEQAGNVERTVTLARTMPGVVMGTIAYMSPEQARGQDIDQSSDVFSLGVVIYEMVTGELPFKGDSPLDTMHSIAFEEARPVTILRRNLPPQVHRIISRCLRKRPEDRFPDAKALAEDLKSLKRDLETGVVRPVSVAERLDRFAGWFKSVVPMGPQGIILAVLVVAVTAALIFTKLDLAGLFWALLLGLLVYRYIRNRKTRMLKNFVVKISKIPEVKAIAVRDDEITVIADRAVARLYIRVNEQVEEVNKKTFFGKPVSASVRDDLSSEEFQTFLRGPGVVYVREEKSRRV